MNEAKSFNIDKRLVYEAYKAVGSNKGSAGIDGIDIQSYERNVSAQLLFSQLFLNRLSSCYNSKK